MDYILSKINQKITFLKGTSQDDLLKVHYQAKFEYFLFLSLSYLWSKNWDKLDSSAKEYCIENILKPSIGSIVSVARKLDLEKEIFGNKKEKDLHQTVDKYPAIRNEKIGHGYSFEDDTEKLLSLFEKMIESVEDTDLAIIKNNNDLILVLDEKQDVFTGINFKPDGFTYVPWNCPKTIGHFDKNSVYALTPDNSYVKISPFIDLDKDGEAFVFSSIQEKLTGRVKYNRLLKTGSLLKDREEFSSLLISNEKHKRKTASGTIINNFEKNYKKFIDTGIKDGVRQFLLKNKSSVFATIWGHGGVGKTATIQSLCEDLSNDDSKYFDYIIFISAKDRYYNYYKGAIHEIENNLNSHDNVIKYINNVITDTEKFDEESIQDFEGKLLLIIDDFETFSKEENKNIIEFIKKLNINHHKVILTTRSATFVTGEEIKTSELTPEETGNFLIEAAKIELPSFNTDLLKKDLAKNGNLASVHEITSGRPLFIFQFAILLGQKGSLEETIKYDIKSTKEAINFLYDRIYDYLSLDAKNMFVAISLLTKEDDLSNLLEKLKFILNKENKDEEFQSALNELIKLKIIELVDKDFFKVYSPEIYRLMKKYYEKKGAEYEGNITNRFQLISDDKTLDTDWSLLENADSSRIISSEVEVENKYRYILNREKCPMDVKLTAAINFSTYLVTHKGKIDKAIKLFEDYYHIFYRSSEYIKYYAKYCWAEGSDSKQAEAIEILKNYFATKPKIDTEIYLDLLGTLMTYTTIVLISERESLKEKHRYNEIDHKAYKLIYEGQKERFGEVFKYPGLKLYNVIKDLDMKTVKPYVRHSALEGLSHFIEICIRNTKLGLAKEVCQYVFDNFDPSYHRPFIFKLSKIDSMENPSRKVDPFKKAETEFGALLKDALTKK
jgi:hypothetical protein